MVLDGGGSGVSHRWITHHVVGPGNEVSSPLDVSDWALPFMKMRRLPTIQPVFFIEQKLWEKKSVLQLIRTSFQEFHSPAYRGQQMTIAQMLPVGHVLDYTELSPSCCKWGGSNYFLNDEVNSTLKLMGTKRMNTNHLLDCIRMRMSFIHWQKNSFYYFTSYTSFAREGRCENLMYKKPYFIYPSSSYHIGYTPFTVDTVGSDKYRNMCSLLNAFMLWFFTSMASHTGVESIVWGFCFSPQWSAAHQSCEKTVESLCCKCRKRTKAGIHTPALLLSLLYKQVFLKKSPRKSAYYQGCREKVV